MEVRGPFSELWESIDGLDEERADRALVGLLWDVPLTQAIVQVVIPFLEELGARAEQGTLSVAHEHFASNLLRRRLSALVHQHEVRPEEDRQRPRALLACPPGEQHDLILLCFALLLGEQGWHTTFLGADTPIEALVSAAREADVDAVVLAATRSTRLTAHRQVLAELSVDHPVHVAGRGADEEVARLLHARLLPDDVAEALEHVSPRRSD